MFNEDQIVKFQNAKKLLEFNDHLSIANVEMAANLHAPYSKINLVAIDTTAGKKEKAIAVSCNVDPIKFKILYEKVKDKEHMLPSKQECNSNEIQEMVIGYGTYKDLTPSQLLSQKKSEGIKILKDLAETFKKNAKKYPINNKKISQINNALTLYSQGKLKVDLTLSTNKKNELFLYEQKALPSDKKKNDKGENKCTILSILYNPKMDSCWNITIENGWCQIEAQKNGGSAIKKSSYHKDKSVKVVLSNDRFKEMLRQTNDYILLKESIFIRILYPQVSKLKQEKRKAFSKNAQ